MLEWFAQIGPGISAVASIGTLLVWIVYLSIFLRQYRRQTQPKIVINRAIGSTLDATCFVSNMSSEPIYLEAILAIFEAGGKRWQASVTDVAVGEKEPPADPRQRTRQGPMRSGDYMPIGSFREMLDRVWQENPELADTRIENFETSILRIKIFADYAAEDLVVGAERAFGLEKENGTWSLRTFGEFTDQIRSRKRRRIAQQELVEHG